MYSLKTLAEHRHDLNADRITVGNAGSNGAWVLKRYPVYNGVNFKLIHHGTLMMDWTEYGDKSCEIHSVSQGWNSSSDQGGMNTFFWNVGIPLYFSRKDRSIRQVNSRNIFLALTIPSLQ